MENTKKNFWEKANIYLLSLNFFFLQSYLIRFQLGSYPTNLQEILIGLSAISFFFAAIKSKSLIQTIKNLRLHWVIMSFILLTLASILFVTFDKNLDFLRHAKFLFFGIVLTLIFLETLPKSEEKKKVLRIAGLGAAIFGIFSVIYNLLGYNVAHDLRLLGPLDAAVYLAYYFTPFFLFFSMEYLENPKSRASLVLAIILGLLVLSTRSMGAIGGSFIVLLAFVIKKNNVQFFRTKIGKTTLAAAGIIVVGLIFYTKILPTLQTDYSSLTERGEIWETSIELLKEPKNAIFGIGLGQFQPRYFGTVYNVLDHTPLDFFVLQPHNIFLLFILNFGLLGLGFLLLLIVKTTKKILTLDKRKSLDISAMAAFIILYFVIHGMIDTPFFKNDLMILFILFLEIGLVKQPTD